MNPSKQFWKSFDTSAGYKLQVEERDGKQVGLVVYHPDLSRRGMNIPADLAPALALAILEAAGIVLHDPENTPYDRMERTTNMGDVNVAAYYLFTHVTRAEKIAHIQAKEAADREALEAEALELLNAVRASNGNASVDSLDKIAGARDPYLTVARKAREMYKAKS